MDLATFSQRVAKTPALAAIAFAVFVVSFFLPAIDLGIASVKGYSAAIRSFNWMTGGAESALGELSRFRDSPETHYDQYGETLKEIWFQSAWSLNVLFLVCLVLIVRNQKIAVARVICVLSFLWALFGIFDTTGGSISIETEGWGLGYWLWAASFALLFVGIFSMRPESDTAKA